MGTRFSIFLLFMVLGVSAGQATSKLGTWQTISHQDSEITILSDTFRVGTIHRKKKMDLNLEVAELFLGTEKVGSVYLKYITTQSFCGFSGNAIDNYFKPDGFIQKYRAISGARNDLKAKLLKTTHGYGSYMDLKGERGRCIVTAQFVGFDGWGACAGARNAILQVRVCRTPYEESANLDRQVFRLIDTLRVDGSGKELILDDRSLANKTNKAICNGLKYENPSYVEEAKRRGISGENCASTVKSETTAPSTPNKKLIEQRLRKLKKLLNDGVVTPDEATAKRKEILQGL